LSIIGKDKYGIFPIKGKLMNVKNHTDKKILENKEITDLKHILGLRQVFKTKEDLKQLRYGSIIILTDQDTDGSHIKGLVMNWIHTYWPSLMRLDFNKSLATPILKAFKGKKVKKFYTESDYRKWMKRGDRKGWNIEYYKGLGTHDDKEAAECFIDFEDNLITYEEDNEEETTSVMNLAFNDGIDKESKQKWSDRRKTWLMDYNPDEIIEQSQKNVSYVDFINKDLIHFSNDDTSRSLPSVMDGLKPSQRKVLYSGIKRYKKDKKDIKVAEFQGYVTYESKYHHGEKSIIEATVKMAQTFVGANNVNYFMPKGNFGSRLQGGKDHASERYIKTNLNPIVLDIFNPDDELVLNFENDEGSKIEPQYYMPVIPMILVNGTNGIGTAFSSTVCSHRLDDVCQAVLNKMQGKPVHKLRPYFRGFQGRIVDLGNGKYETIGLYKIVAETNTIHITELPVGGWTDKYTKFIEDKIMKQTKKKYITSYENYCTKNTIHYILKLSSDGVRKYSKRDYDFIIKDLGLKKSFSTNNMHLYDANGIIHKFANTEEILDYFVQHRKTYYIKRKEALIIRFAKEVEKLREKVRFIKYYNAKKIIVRKKTRQELEQQLINHEFKLFDESYEYLTNMSIISLTNERAKQLEEKCHQMEHELELLKEKTIETMWTNDMNGLIKTNKLYNTSVQKLMDEEKENMGKTRRKNSSKSTKSKSKRKSKKKLMMLDI